MKTECPHCKAKLNVPDQYEGKKVKCPKCKEQFEVMPHIGARSENSQETRSSGPGISTTVLAAVISGALGLGVGLVSGVLLTMPSRDKTRATISTVESKANEMRTEAQREVQAAKAEAARCRNELESVAAELKQVKNNNYLMAGQLQEAQNVIEKRTQNDKEKEAEKSKRLISADFTLLRKWKPANAANGFGADVLLQQELSEKELVLFVKQLAGSHDPSLFVSGHPEQHGGMKMRKQRSSRATTCFST